MMKFLLLLVSLIATTLATKMTSNSTQQAVYEVQAATMDVERPVTDSFLMMAKENNKPMENAMTQLDSYVFKGEKPTKTHFYDMDNGTLIVVIILIVILVIICIIICCCCCACCMMAGAAAAAQKEESKKMEEKKEEKKEEEKKDDMAPMMME